MWTATVPQTVDAEGAIQDGRLEVLVIKLHVFRCFEQHHGNQHGENQQSFASNCMAYGYASVDAELESLLGPDCLHVVFQILLTCDTCETKCENV